MGAGLLGIVVISMQGVFHKYSLWATLRCGAGYTLDFAMHVQYECVQTLAKCRRFTSLSDVTKPVSYTHLTLPTIYSV